MNKNQYCDFVSSPSKIESTTESDICHTFTPCHQGNSLSLEKAKNPTKIAAKVTNREVPFHEEKLFHMKLLH